MLFWVFDGDNTILILAVSNLERKQLQMIRIESELHLSHPYPARYHLILVLKGNVEEDGRFQQLSIFKLSDIEVEVKGVLGEGIKTDWQITLHHLFD